MNDPDSGDEFYAGPKQKSKESAESNHRLLWWFGLLLIAMIASYPDPRAIMAFYLFPIGLAKIFTPSGPGYEPYGIYFVVTAYVFYAVHLILFPLISSKNISHSSLDFHHRADTEYRRLPYDLNRCPKHPLEKYPAIIHNGSAPAQSESSGLQLYRPSGVPQ